MSTQHQLQQTHRGDQMPSRASDLLPPFHPPEPNQQMSQIHSTSSPATTHFHTPHPLRLHAHYITDATTRKDIFAISEDQANNKPSLFSSKQLVTLTHCETNTPLGTICTGGFSTSSIEITTADHKILLSSASHTRRKWGFTPRAATEGDRLWVWQRDKRRRGTVILTDAKRNGRTIARIAGDLLTFEGSSLSVEMVDDVFWTAVAMAVHVRRQRKNGDVLDVGEAIVGPNYSKGNSSVGSGGGGDGGSGGDGGGGCGGDGGGSCS